MKFSVAAIVGLLGTALAAPLEEKANNEALQQVSRSPLINLGLRDSNLEHRDFRAPVFISCLPLGRTLLLTWLEAVPKMAPPLPDGM